MHYSLIKSYRIILFVKAYVKIPNKTLANQTQGCIKEKFSVTKLGQSQECKIGLTFKYQQM